jgi:hypothetical protein
MEGHLRYMKQRAEQIQRQMDDIRDRLFRYDGNAQTRMTLALNKLSQRKHALLSEIRRHELP